MSKQPSIREMIEAKGMTAPIVRPEDLDNEIDPHSATIYHVFPDSTITICQITLKNGYRLIGKSACASKENFDEEIGRKVAYEDAKNQLWELLGFRLRDKLAAAERSNGG